MKLQKTLIAGAVCAALLSTACSNTSAYDRDARFAGMSKGAQDAKQKAHEKEQARIERMEFLEKAPIETDKPERTSKNVALSWQNDGVSGSAGQGGAAQREMAYVHVLSNPKLATPKKSESKMGDGVNNDGKDDDGGNGAAALLASSDNDGGDNYNGNGNKNGLTGYSVYELQRWERYCDQGKRMDERDWKFVESNQYKVPVEAIDSCHKPQHNIADYMTAWHRYCNNLPEYSPADVTIVKNSVRPISMAGSCPRLEQ